MAPVTDSPRSDGGDLALRWSGQISLTRRILAVNIFALALLAGGFSYLGTYRSRIVDTRLEQAAREARLMADAVGAAPAVERDRLVQRLARETDTRVRLFTRSGAPAADSRALGVRNFVLVDPDRQGFHETWARWLDVAIDAVIRAPRPPLYREHGSGADWPDVRLAASTKGTSATIWRAPDRTPVLTAAAPMAGGGVLMSTADAADITRTVRAERLRLGVVLLVVSIVSILLSLFLARTIVRPLRRLARAAVRVRLGRAREVVVPRLPSRRDEIGSLARALSDMSQALRARIDATEAFAADVTHELKNPLASLRSAVDGIAHVNDRTLQAKLLGIAREDVHRLDRLISDISEASRLDAQLSRAKFEPVDIDALLRGLVGQREARGVDRDVRLLYDHRPSDRLVVSGEGARLERVFENLLDNAISFSPNTGLVVIAAAPDGDALEVRVEDEGPGVPEAAREDVFRRFQSIRPAGEAFGRHSGLGLAIARTIIEAHGGTIRAEGREDRLAGARFVVRLPRAMR